MRFVIDVMIAMVLTYVVIDAVREYRGAVGSIWQRLLAVGKNTATILWARFVIAVAAFADGGIWLAEFLGQPSVAGAIQSYMKPSYVAGLMIAVAVISELARRRRMPMAPSA